MRAIILSIACLLTATAMEYSPDFRDRDKQLHAVAGAGVVLVAQPVNRWLVNKVMPDATRGQKRLARILLDSAEATAVGFGKEYFYDARTEGRTVSVGDALATGAGGAAFSVVLNFAIN